MSTLVTFVALLVVLALLGLALSVRVVKQYERACCSGWAGSSGCGSQA